MPTALPGVLARSTIVLFGDSLTQRGFEPEGWAAALAHYYGRRADVYNRGYGGYNTRWARELAPALFARPPQGQAHLLATVWFGANDACISTERAHVPLLEYEANLETIVEQARQVARVVVVMTPPPVHGPSRLAYQKRKYGARATGVEERSTEVAGRYGDVAARVAGRHGCALLDVHQLMLREADWPRYVGAGSEEGDGLHLSGAGQRFVAEKLLALLPTLGLDRDALAYDAPWGFEVDAKAPAASLRAHFARHRGALQANSGVPGLDREESRPLPGAPSEYSYGGVPAGAFLLGVACGVVLLALTRRPRRVRFRN